MASARSNKRERILEAAMQLMMEQGFAEARVSDIAQAAGVGKGTVYEYFDSKESIYLELFQKEVASRYEAIPRLLEEAGPSCRDKLRCFLEADLSIARYFGASTHMIGNLLPNPETFHDPQITKALQDLIIFRVSVLHDILAAGMESGEFTPADPIMATITILGSLSFYEGLLCHLLPEEYAGLLPQDPKHWDSEEFFRFIINGLSA